MAVLQYDSAIGKHLRSGEKLRWVGRSRQGWRFRWNNRLIILQAVAAIISIFWMARMAAWGLVVAGFAPGLAWRHPSIRSSAIVFVFFGVTAWQLNAERRRRRGTWYAVTDRRILFVLTTVKPESVVAVEFDELSQVSLNAGLEFFGSLRSVILKLKKIDPYMANSDVLGYQMAANGIVLEDVEQPQEFVDQVVAARLARHSQPEATS